MGSAEHRELSRTSVKKGQAEYGQAEYGQAE